MTRRRRPPFQVLEQAPGLRVRLGALTSTAAGTVGHVGALAQSLDSVTAAAAGGVPEVTTETATFTAGPASWHDRRQASIQGTHGSTRSGLYWVIPATGSETDRYVWWSHDDGDGRQTGLDPGNYVAALSGYTGVEVPLAAGPLSASAVATATRTALSGLYTTIGGTGADVSIEGEIDSATCSVGGMWSPSSAGAWGTRRSTPQFTGNPLSGRIGQFGVSPAADVIVTALGMYLAASTDDVRVALYSGGTQASLTGTALVAEVVIPAGDTGWRWGVLTADEAATLSSSTNIRWVAKSNGTSDPGYIAVSDLVGTDFPDAGAGSTYDLEIYDTMSTDPSVAFPSTLAGEGITTAGAYAMFGMQYQTADGTSATWTTRIGTHIPDPTDLDQTSSLTVPDAGGADLYMGVAHPGILGMQLTAWAVCFSTHTAQLRAHVVQGGSVGSSVGGTVLWQAQTTGSDTGTWHEEAIANVALADDSSVLHWGCRNNAATAAFRFAFQADRALNSPDSNPADWSDASEFEIFRSVNGNGTGGDVHETNPAVAVASPIATDGGGTAANTNYPGAYLRLRVPPDTVTA